MQTDRPDEYPIDGTIHEQIAWMQRERDRLIRAGRHDFAGEMDGRIMAAIRQRDGERMAA